MGVSVFGHRGACGYLPENTMASFEMAFELGSDAIEFDVVMTKDGVPVILHDLDLANTTTISEHPGLAPRICEITAVELAQLRAIERYPQGRLESAQQSGKFPIPTLAEVLTNPKFNGKHLIVELKYGAELSGLGLDLIAAVKTELGLANWEERGIKITIECFEFGVLRDAKKAIAGQIDYVFLSAPDMLPEGRTSLEEDLLDEIAKEFEGLSVAIPMLWQDNLVTRAKDRDLKLFAYTARIETAEGSVDSWFKKLALSGVDGIFCDQPDLMLKTVASLS